ncbi:LamG domain-containing protein [Streptomyces sp. NBC_00103]|uniref:LamG domain-containing protein n=1 Tax=Streptomyces sp. NBC_00103 TaxID=2975653 RepID=UPI00225028BF|nr:LamG-like jellyroll fold domain-containing protein [Streptomyces sp. NBC_00103]MCX5370288.1 LamG domain protein jellyroll fold domain protein [Streptomyces sp. NBC_00103]
MLALPAQEAVAASPEADSAPLTEGQQALAEAEKSGQRVEVTGERTDRTTVYANPDGFTFTLEQSAVPIRVAKAGGGWQAPDATLEKRSDGSVGPKAAAVSIAFSAGGDKAPLARIEDQGNSLELEWPGKLPAPRLDGPSAVYAEVLPGVDLQVTATPESFQPVFVVKTPEAAANEELKKLTFGLKAQGLDVREGAAGNLAAVDGSGRTVFKAPPARMWDSAGEAAVTPQTPQTPKAAETPKGTEKPKADGTPETAVTPEVPEAPKVPATPQTPETPETSETAGAQPQLLRAQVLGEEPVPGEEPVESSDPAEVAPSGSGLEPGQGDKVARMDVAVTKDSLSVVPDTEMLTESDASAFPLFIDPTVTWGESERTLLRSDGYESYGWSNGDDDQGKGAGKCGTWNGYYCGPGYVQKLYFEFSPASLKGKKVLDATFRVTEPWAFQCDPRWVDLVRTNNISSATTWSSRPAELDLMVDRNVSAGRGSLCDPDAPDAPIEFNDNPDETNENLTSTVSNFAAGKFSRLTLEIKAHDESDTAAWKRFKNDAVLAVNFVGLPDKPSAVGIVTGSGTVCETAESDPAIVSDPTPTLAATAQTKSGGEKDAQLRIAYDLDSKSGSTWVDTTPGNGDARPSTGYVGDNTKVTLTWSTLTDGTLYRYRSWVRSYYNGGASNLPGPSNASTTGWCYFKVDSSAPKAPGITVGSPYTACTTNDCTAHGGPAVKGTFKFGPASGDTNVAYQYKLSSTAAWSPDQTGASVSVGITPTKAGTYRLYVRAKDNVARYGAQSVVDFVVADGEKPVGQWQFGEADGTAVDSATWDGADNATPSGGAVRDDRGRRGLITRDAAGVPLATPVTDKGLALDGSTGYAATAGTVLDTAGSYTVAAWVRVDPASTKTVTVLSQSAATTSPFTKKYSPFIISYGGKWSMRVLGTDGAFHEAAAPNASPKGVWTYVAGVHDAVAKKVHLYVNGRLQASVDAGTAWHADGAFQIGRLLYADNYVDYFKGSIDEPTAWQRALSAEEIADDARTLTSQAYAGVELVADWSADRGVDSTVADTTSGYGRSLTLGGGASLNGESIVLDGVDDAATTAGPVVDDTGSFTVTTLASLDATALAGKSVGYTGQVVGQRTADGSAWGFWYELTDKQTVLDEETLEEKTVPVGFWRFGRLNANGTFSAVASEEAAMVDGAVRMTGVLNAQDGTIGLYLGAVQNGDDEAFTAKIGSGDFAVGKDFAGNAWGHYLPGRVADVRLWAGAMAGSEQIEETVGD